MEKSGKIIPINQTFVLLYMFALLDQYDIASDRKHKGDVDPYREKITMKTDDNKYVEIPEELQKYAIQKWIEMKGEKNGKPSYESDYDKTQKAIFSEHDDDDTDDDRACLSCRKERKMKGHTLIDTTFQLILCLLIIFTLLYTLSLTRQGILKF